MAWWRQRPSWLRWSMWAGIVGAVSTLIGTAMAFAQVFGAIEGWVPATRGYVERAVAPILIIGLENKIANADGRQETLRARLDMLARGNPNDPAIRAAKEILLGAIDNLDTVKARADCDIREAHGLKCAGR